MTTIQTATAQGFMFLLPANFYNIVDTEQQRILSDAYTTLIDVFGRSGFGR